MARVYTACVAAARAQYERCSDLYDFGAQVPFDELSDSVKHKLIDGARAALEGARFEQHGIVCAQVVDSVESVLKRWDELVNLDPSGASLYANLLEPIQDLRPLVTEFDRIVT